MFTQIHGNTNIPAIVDNYYYPVLHSHNRRIHGTGQKCSIATTVEYTGLTKRRLQPITTDMLSWTMVFCFTSVTLLLQQSCSFGASTTVHRLVYEPAAATVVRSTAAGSTSGEGSERRSGSSQQPKPADTRHPAWRLGGP